MLKCAYYIVLAALGGCAPAASRESLVPTPVTTTIPADIPEMDIEAGVDLGRYVGADVIIEGTAENVPHDALLTGGENESIFVLDRLRTRSWPTSANGKRVRARGKLLHYKYFPDPLTDERGRIIGSGMKGLQYVLEDAVWTVIDPEE